LRKALNLTPAGSVENKVRGFIGAEGLRAAIFSEFFLCMGETEKRLAVYPRGDSPGRPGRKESAPAQAAPQAGPAPTSIPRSGRGRFEAGPYPSGGQKEWWL